MDAKKVLVSGGARGIGAGIVRPALAEDTSPDDFSDVINLDVGAAPQCVQAVLPAMRQERLIGYNFKPMDRTDVAAIFGAAL